MNFLFRNLGGMRFEDVSLLSGAGVNSAGRAFGGMGVNAGDLDGDGLPDLLVANFEAEPNSFYRNVGEGIFEDAAANSGFGAPAFNFSGFGLNLLDAANAGWLDAYIANGHVLEVPKMQGVTYAERPFFMWNDGKGHFVERGCGEAFRKAIVGRGSAVADYDNDGDVDIAVSSSGGALQLLRNDGKHGNWVGFSLVGGKSNRQGIGARITVETDRGTQTRELRAGESYLSSCDPRVHFGLGASTTIRRVEVRWPSGVVQKVEGAKPGRYQQIVEPPPAGGETRPAPLGGTVAHRRRRVLAPGLRLPGRVRHPHLVDTLRADRLPAYGYRRATPALDALARESVLFENALSHVPLTLPSHVSIFTGLLPFRHGVRDNVGYRLADSPATLAGISGSGATRRVARSPPSYSTAAPASPGASTSGRTGSRARAPLRRWDRSRGRAPRPRGCWRDGSSASRRGAPSSRSFISTSLTLPTTRPSPTGPAIAAGLTTERSRRRTRCWAVSSAS